MQKFSAGILLFNYTKEGEIKVLLVHPGGPFYKNKDAGVWSIPKGEYAIEEDPLAAAKREFNEETGNEVPDGLLLPLKPIKIKSGKTILAWALEAELPNPFIKSNQFEMEWPPASGKKRFFSEVDKAEWFHLNEAKIKINNGQKPLLEQLEVMVQQENN